MYIRKAYSNGTSMIISLPAQLVARIKLTPGTYCKIEQTGNDGLSITPLADTAATKAHAGKKKGLGK